nr:putative reverse transcriptase domain-containing protein [Tanacetum cinerariifolium]
MQLIQKLCDDKNCMKKVKPLSKLKAIEDIINIGSFIEALVLNHYVLVRKIVDDDDESSDDANDDDDEKDEEASEDEDDDEEEEPLAPADSSTIPVVDPVPSASNTKAFEIDESAPTPPLPISPQIVIPLPPLPISSPPLPSPSPPTTSLTYVESQLGYKAADIRMRGASPPLLLSSTSHMTDIPEDEMPRDRVREIGYGITYTRDEIVKAMQEITSTTLEGVNQKVTQLATTVRQDTDEFYVRFEDAKDDRAFLRARVNTLFIDRLYHLWTVMLLDREATYACRAWVGSEDRSAAIEAHTLEARDPEPQDEPAKAGSSYRSENIDDSHDSGGDGRRRMHVARECTYTDFLKCQPLKFKATKGVVDRSENIDDSHDSGGDGRRRMHVARECTYTDFLKCQPLKFKATKGVIGLTQWTVGHDIAYAMPWKTSKQMMTDKYCPRELALMCDRMFPEESDEVEKYVGGLPDMFHESVKVSKPKIIQEAIEFTTELVDQKILTLVKHQAKNKRKFDDTSRNNQNQQQPFKMNNVAWAYTVRPEEKKPYWGSKPLCPNATTIMMGSVLLNAPTARGLVIQPRTVKASLLLPTTREPKGKIKEFASALSLVSYYRRFIEGFSKIAKSMTKLTQNKVRFNWDDKGEAAFQLIKKKLCSAPILALLEGSKDFIVYCDASIKGLGDMLMQREKRSFKKALGTRLDTSTAYHSKIDGQSERTIQTLEDMLCAYVIDCGSGLETHLPLIEFSCNNSYQASIKVAPFEALNDRKCRSLVCWAEFDGTLGEVLRSHGNVKINSGRSIRISSQKPHPRQVPHLKPYEQGSFNGGRL